MLKADEINLTIKDGKWVVAKPIKQPLVRRIKDAIQVIKGNAEAVSFENK